MKRPSSVPRGRVYVALLVTLLVLPSRARAQGGGGPGTQPAQIPLSGQAAQGAAIAAQTSLPGPTASVNTLNPSIQVQGPLVGSTSSTPARPFSGKLSLREAIERGLEYNLSGVGLTQLLRQARAQEKLARSALMPNVVGSLSDMEQQVNLAALGVRFDVPFPGFSLPGVVGPFNVLDLRARLSQTVIDLTALNNYRAARETARANELSAQDTHDLIVLAVGGAYLQTIAARAKVQSARAQVETASALFQRATQQRDAGLATPIDVNRAQVQMLTQQQRLVSLQADFAKQKINLARMTGLPPTDQYDLVDEISFSAAPSVSVEDAVRQAAERRADLKAAEAQVRAAELALAAAQAGRLPSVSLNADYGVSRSSPTPARSTFAVVAAVRVPIWEGGRSAAQIDQATAALAQRRAEAEDLRGQIEGDIRKAYVDLQAAASQVEVAQANRRLSADNLGLTRQRFDAGVSDNVAVVESQESLAAAELDYIASVFAHNLAKLGLARALGRAAEDLSEFLRLP